MKKKVDLIILSQYFYPELISTGQLLTELAEDFAADGKPVLVIAGQPTYYGASRVPKVMYHRGIEIRRVWSTQLNKNSLVGRIVNNLTFLFSMAAKIRLLGKATNLLVVTCPSYLPLLGVLSKYLFSNRVYTVLHDVYPDVLVALGYLKSHSLVTRILNSLTRWILMRSDKVIVLGRDMRDVVKQKLPDSQHDKVCIIENWADGNLIKCVNKEDSKLANDLALQNKFVVQYSGNIGRLHDIESLVRSAKALENESVEFLFIGSGGQAQHLEVLAKELGLVNVRLLPYQPKELLTDSLCCSDLSVVSLSQGFEGLSIPSKLYGILASGRPVLAVMSPHTEVALTVGEGRCGFIVNPGDVDGIVRVVRTLKYDSQLRDCLGKNARLHFEKKYERKFAYAKFRELMLLDESTGQIHS